MFKQLYGKNKIEKLAEIINKIENEYLEDNVAECSKSVAPK